LGIEVGVQSFVSEEVGEDEEKMEESKKGGRGRRGRKQGLKPFAKRVW
jgi:hypothetical protein